MRPTDSISGGAGSLASLAMSVHRIAGSMPVAIKERNGRGLVVAGGTVQEAACECDALDSLFHGEPVRKVTADRGRYAGIPMFAAAILDRRGEAVAAIGLIDTSGLLSLQEFAEIGASFGEQTGSRPSREK